MQQGVKNAKVEAGETSNFVRQGSLRRVIQGELNDADMFLKRKNELSNIYQTIHLEYIILAEYKTVISECIQGIYVIPSNENFLTWFGVIFVKSGLYEGGIFRFNLNIDADFPNTTIHPVIKFESKMFHPLVDPETNELNCSGAFPKWDKTENHIWQLLKFVVWSFENLEISLAHSIDENPAGKLFANDKETFKKQVNEIVSESIEHLYDEPKTSDKHYITFEVYDENIHGLTKAQLLMQGHDDFFKCKNSWVMPGSHLPLGRPMTPSKSLQES